jgi:hypothetical protein
MPLAYERALVTWGVSRAAKEGSGAVERSRPASAFLIEITDELLSDCAPCVAACVVEKHWANGAVSGRFQRGRSGSPTPPYGLLARVEWQVRQQPAMQTGATGRP